MHEHRCLKNGELKKKKHKKSDCKSKSHKVKKPINNNECCEKSKKTTLEILNKPEFSAFLNLLQITGVNKFLENGTYTILAPSNQAISSIPGSILGNQGLLTDILLYHIIEGTICEKSLIEKTKSFIETVLEKSLYIITNKCKKTAIVDITSNEVQIKKHYCACNGIVYKINGILYPTKIYVQDLLDASMVAKYQEI